ncbi:MAG: HlyD family efflux transporter periplasmic adaptor subunit [Thermogutta sp.]|jgi:multidrug efflux pump subunit AcrA (membrane-fusion protein)|nr:HlyD family efflux transporter periplasmic adaptor subunit [Thermogutta terrifontis]
MMLWFVLNIVLWGLEVAAPSADSAVVTLPNCPVSIIDEAQVPARVQGQLIELSVKEGDTVKRGDVLGRIDDAVLQKTLDVKRYQLEAAKKDADNDVNVRYAKWANLVADAEYQQAVDANNRAPGAVPQAELRRLLLERGKTSLAIEQAAHDLEVAKLTVQVRQAELAEVEEQLRMYQIVAPIDGVIIKRFLHAGEWVKPGDPVFHVVRMDRLRIEGMVSAEKYLPAQLDKAPVVFVVKLPQLGERQFQGQVVYVSPVVEVTGEFMVWAEIVNVRDERSGHWLLRPGLTGQLTIRLNP